MLDEYDKRKNKKWLRVELWLILCLIFIGIYTAYNLNNHPNEQSKGETAAFIRRSN